MSKFELWIFWKMEDASKTSISPTCKYFDLLAGGGACNILERDKGLVEYLMYKCNMQSSLRSAYPRAIIINSHRKKEQALKAYLPNLEKLQQAWVSCILSGHRWVTPPT
ncbi:hypothetical protein L208DRAFT_1383017 [Tricholoma matsutake]|nr:hypothetical protein L208DRAFT_1383017 [Tricholoma matsutake 945]